MKKEYRKLFSEIALGNANFAEEAMNKTSVQEQKLKSEKMRDDFLNLRDKIDNENYELDLKDFTKLYIGASLVSASIKAKIKTWEKVVEAYNDDLLPKLKKVLEAKDDYKEIEKKYF